MKRLARWVATALVPLLVAACGGDPNGTTGTGGTGGDGGQGGTGGDGGQGGTGGDGGQGGSIVNPTKGEWSPDFGLPGAAAAQGARVKASILGPDGLVYAGGIFEEIAGTKARNVAAWDGTTWRPLGAGLPGTVNALSIGGDGALYAGGELLDESGKNHIARWDGTTWEWVDGEIDGPVLSLAPWAGNMLVGGDFPTVSGLEAGGIAAYDGGWSTLDGGVAQGAVHSILVEDDTRFCVGGTFGAAGGDPAANVACWDHTGWTQLGDGLPGTVYTLQGDLAGGSFAFVDPQTGDYKAGLARMENGKWTPLAGGVDDGFINEVRAIATDDDGGIHVGGHFLRAGKGTQDLPVSHYAYLKDGQWSTPGYLINKVGLYLPHLEGVHTFTLDDDGSLFVGGIFSSAGLSAATNVARLDDGTFQPLAPDFAGLGLSGIVNDLTADANGRLIAAGRFDAAGANMSARNLAVLGDHGWEPAGAPLEGTLRAVQVMYDGRILAGGDFVGDGGEWLPYLAVLDDIGWVPLGPELDGPVTALLAKDDGTVHVGGDFQHAGDAKIRHLARWTGAEYENIGPALDGRVTTIAEDASGRLFVGGLFTRAGAKPVNGIAMWDGEVWSDLAGGLDGPGGGYIRVIATVGDDVYAGGHFSQIGGQAISALARWDGRTWHPVGEALSYDNDKGPAPVVTDIVPHEGGLFITGTFQRAGGEIARRIAWYDGEKVVEIGGGLSDLGESLLVQDSRLFVGGTFISAGDRVSSGVALWQF